MPRMTWEEWKGFSRKKRTRYLNLLDASDDEDDSSQDLFAGIAPSLRVADFESSVDNWEQVQANFDQIGASRATWSSTSSRTSLVGDVLARIDEIVGSRMQQVSDRLANLELVHRSTAVELETVRQSQEESAFLERARIPMYDMCRISGQAGLMRDILQPFASVDLPPLPILLQMEDPNEQFQKNILTYFPEDPDYDNPAMQAQGYEVFQVIDDFEHTLQRFFIQPRSEREIASYGTGFNHYRQSIEHFIDRNRSPIAHLMDAGATLSVIFHCQINGVDRNHMFREYPGSAATLQDYITMVYTEDGGSDKIYKKLRTNIVALSVTVVNPYVGGSPKDSRRGVAWLRCFDYMASARKRTNENSCLYACVRYLWKITDRSARIKQNTYGRMRRQLTGDENDNPAPTSLLNKLLPTFGVDVIVLGSALPKITPSKPCKTQNGYFELECPYTIEYDTIFFQPAPGGSLVESSDNLLSFNSTGHACFVTIGGKPYFLLCLQNNHYSVVSTIFRPTVCQKCGSTKHTAKQAMDNDQDRLDCLENLRDVLTLDQLKKAAPNISTVIFDFETVVFKGILIPYSVSWCVMDMWGAPGPVRNHIGPHAANFVLNSLRFNTPGIKTLVGYNSSRFDNYLVMHQLLLDGTPLNSTNSTVFNNQILKLSTKEFKTWDICQFTKCTLDQAAEAYGLHTSKLKFDHKHVQSLFDQHGWAFIDVIGRETIKEYNNQDVLLTAQLFNIVTPSLETITGIDPLSCMTLSQLAFKHMTQFNTANGLTLTQVPLKYDYIFDTVPAGRVQMFVDRGIYDGDYVQVDANGLYQYIALNYSMSDGEVSWFNTFHEFEESTHPKELYLVECSVDQSSLRIKLVGQKQKDECIDWTRNEIESCWLWREEIEMLESLNCEVRKRSVLAWPETVKPFEVMNVYKTIRLKEKKEGRDGGVIDLQAKLCSNAITGKCYQRNRTEEWAVVGSLTECEKFKQTHSNVTFDTTDLPRKYYVYGDSDRLSNKEFIDKPRHMGARIYAMARLYMFSIIKDLESIMYMDTDGWIMSRIEKEATPALAHSVELGGFKIEAEGDRVYLCSLKNYAIVNTMAEKTCLEAPHLLKADKKKCEKDGFYHNKYRLKGYHNDDPWFSALDKYKGTFVNENIYKALIEDQPVCTKTEKIVKRFVHQGTGGTYTLSTLVSQIQERIIA